jgi:hypothetical protein
LSDRIGLLVQTHFGAIKKRTANMLGYSMSHELTLHQFMGLDRVAHAQDNQNIFSYSQVTRATKSALTSTLPRLATEGKLRLKKADPKQIER